jgi:hypothetical protein
MGPITHSEASIAISHFLEELTLCPWDLFNHVGAKRRRRDAESSFSEALGSAHRAVNAHISEAGNRT